MNEHMIEQLTRRIPEDLTIRDMAIYPHWITAASARYGLSCFYPVMPGVSLPPAPDGFDMKNPTPPSWNGENVRDKAKECLMKKDILSRSLGHALVNSALLEPENAFEGEAQFFYREKIKHKKTCCIGHFKQACEWRDSGWPVTIVELKPEPGDIHWDDASLRLKECDIVFITGLTLINGTFEQVLDMTPNATERVLFGPTVPFCDLWFDYGITAVGSTRIINPVMAAEFFNDGGSSIAHAPEGVLKKINMTRGDLCG
jgi:hypothetical protein